MPEDRRDDPGPGIGLRQSVAPQRTVCHMSEIVEWRPPRFRTSLVESSPNAKLLPTIHSVIAGSVDAIGFLGLGGFFIAHVTGNLVILAAHLAGGACHDDAGGSGIRGGARIGETAGRRLGADRVRIAAIPAARRPFCPVRFRRSAHRSRRNEGDPRGHARRLGYGRAEPTWTDLTESGRRGAQRRAADVAKARDRDICAWPTIVGFAVGCGLGATLEAAIGLRSLALPAGLAFLAVAMGMTGDLEGGHGP